MKAAAAVPMAEVNDKEFAAAASACKSAKEWAVAERKYPNALGMTNPTDADIHNSLAAVCSDPASTATATCLDAKKLGLLG